MHTLIDTLESIEGLEPMDIGTDEEALKKLLETLKILSQFQVSFDDQRAVCQAQVKTLIDECSIALDDRYPLQSFTMLPTPQNLSVVTESLLAKTGETIAALAKRVWETIKAICRWVLKALKSLTGRQHVMVRRQQAVVHLHEANAEIKSSLGDIPPPPPPSPEERAGISEEDHSALTLAMNNFHKAEADYREHMTGLALDLLSEGPAMGAIKASALIMPTYVDHVTLKSKMMVGYMLGEARGDHQPRAEPRVIGSIDPIIGGKLPLFPKLEHTQGWSVVAHATNFAEYMDALKTELYHLHEVRPKGAMDWEIAVKVVINPRAGFGEPLVPIADTIYELIDKLQEWLEATHTPENLKIVTPSATPYYEEMMKNLLGDMHALADYAEASNVVLDAQMQLITDLYHCEAAQFSLNRAMVSGRRDSTLVEVLNRIQDNLRKKIVLRQ